MTQSLPASILILGGARSGKSRRAQSLAESCGLEPVLIATATAGDEEMAARIARHRSGRSAIWLTIEEPLDLSAALKGASRADRMIVVDCLTLWLSNVLFAGQDLESACEDLARGVREIGGPVIFVSNEVGWSIVPENPMARRFRDAQGRLNQQMAEVCARVELVVAGIVAPIKGAANVSSP